MSKSFKILYYGAGWPTNIGNAFIDMGAMAILNQAFPDAHIAFASEMPRWFFRHRVKETKRFPFSGVMREPERDAPMDNALDIGFHSQCDLIVFAGMAMCQEFIDVCGPAVLEQARRGTPVLLLGTGALEYNDQEKTSFSNFLKELKPIGFVSRDDISYDMFSNLVPQSFQGIDSAFFIPYAYQPLSLNLGPYIVSCFDTTEEATIDPGSRLLVRAHHECWGPSPKKYVETENTLISDIPQDYLTLYANAEEVHSDRVHACIVTLAYGRPAKLYHGTPRGSLFSAVGAGNIREEITKLDMDMLNEKKQKEIEFVRELLTPVASKNG